MKKTEAFWNSFISEHPEYKNRNYTSRHFCSDKGSADSLANLVMKGTKQGTASLLDSLDSYKHNNKPVPKTGDLSIITDWDGNPQCIIKILKVWIYNFSDVPESFAAIEGEGDGFLGYWKNVHKSFFQAEAQEMEISFSDDSEIICEQFMKIFPE